MPEQFDGLVEVKNANATTISLDGESGDVIVGGGGRQGNLVIRDGNDVEEFRLESGELILNDPGGTEMIRLEHAGIEHPPQGQRPQRRPHQPPGW